MYVRTNVEHRLYQGRQPPQQKSAITTRAPAVSTPDRDRPPAPAKLLSLHVRTTPAAPARLLFFPNLRFFSRSLAAATAAFLSRICTTVGLFLPYLSPRLLPVLGGPAGHSIECRAIKRPIKMASNNNKDIDSMGYFANDDHRSGQIGSATNVSQSVSQSVGRCQLRLARVHCPSPLVLSAA